MYIAKHLESLLVMNQWPEYILNWHWGAVG